MGHLITNILRWLFSWIDQLVIVIIDWLYSGLLTIASFNVVDLKVVKEFASRLGLLLGIFMLFTIAIQMVTYIISPDKFKDNAKGGSKIAKNIFITFAMLVFYNTIFTTAYKVQYKLIDKQIIPKLIFGVSTSENITEENNISYYLYSSLVSINSAVDTQGVCTNALNEISYDCEKLLQQKMPSEYGTFKYAVQTKKSKYLLNSSLITASDGDEFIINYLFLFSTAVGVIMALMIFNFCLDIAKRSVKLYFYQLIAPVPIIANVVPGKGEEAFKKWTKACISTYLDLFIRLIAFFFAIYIISILYDSLGDTITSRPIIGILLILGSLMFAKELPGIVQDITGVKLDGFTLNPLKKIGDSIPAAAGGFFGAQLAGVKAGGANFLATYKDRGFIRAFGSGLAGNASAFGRGLIGTAKGEKFKDTSTKAYANAMKARLDREDRNKYDISRGEILQNKFQRAIYAQTNSEKDDSELKAYNDYRKSGKDLVSNSESEVQKYANKLKLSKLTDVNWSNAQTAHSKGLTTLAELREAMDDQNISVADRANLKAEYEYLKGEAEAQYRSLAGETTLTSFNNSAFEDVFTIPGIQADTTFQKSQAYVGDMVDVVSKNSSKPGFAGISEYDIRTNSKSTVKHVDSAAESLERSPRFRKDHAVQEQTNKESKK